jgi:hypothetical protein
MLPYCPNASFTYITLAYITILILNFMVLLRPYWTMQFSAFTRKD